MFRQSESVALWVDVIAAPNADPVPATVPRPVGPDGRSNGQCTADVLHLVARRCAERPRTEVFGDDGQLMASFEFEPGLLDVLAAELAEIWRI